MAHPSEDDRREIQAIVQAIRTELSQASGELDQIVSGKPDVLTGDNRRALTRFITRIDRINGSAYQLLKF